MAGKKQTDKIYAEALYEALETEKEGDVKKIVTAFLAVLRGRRALNRGASIIREFETIHNARHGVAKLKITGARELNTKIVQAVAEYCGTKKYEVETTVDTDLIGGFTAKCGDDFYDASVKNNLLNLHKSLTK
jgi:F0F1-type ATP synthase delta subunit